MPNATTPQERDERSFGLIALVENQRVVLPLKAVKCDFSVAAGLVEAHMTQVFRQENPKPLDCEYLFPLPADASVYSCEAEVNGRIIRATVKEREEAVNLAAKKKAEGRRVALVEAERENLFTLALSNLQPQDLILVTLKYIQPLRHLADRASVEIPFCPGVRYIPGNPLNRSNRGKGVVDDTDQVPDASRITPVRMKQEHPDAAFVEITGRIDGKFVDQSSVDSPSHDIISQLDGEELNVRLSELARVPDCDFVLRWREQEPTGFAARAWMSERGEETYALMEIRAPKASGPPEPMDFYFLLDRSGSMQGIKWKKAALAVQTCVKNLTEKDRAMVTLFESSFRDFAEQPLPPEKLLSDENFQRLAERAPGGGTEMGPALKHVLEVAANHAGDRQKCLILITDAQVGNETEILKIMEAAPDLPLHCFGIDMALNDSLLLALARQQRGTFHSLNPSDDVAKAVYDLAQMIRHPVLRDLSLPSGWEPAQRIIPPLYSGQIFHLSAHSKERQALALTARQWDGISEQIPVHTQPASNEAPYLHWCKQRIQRFISERRNSDAIALSVKSNLICPLTAFIAWDEVEKVAVASHSLVQPNLEVLGMPSRVKRAPARAGRFSLAAGQGLTEDLCCHSAPATPSSLCEDLVGDSLSLASQPPAERASLAQSRAEIERGLHEFYRRCELPELERSGDRIIRWAFEREQDAVDRCNLVAELLSRLMPKAEQLQTQRRILVAILAQTEENLRRLELSRRGLNELLGGTRLSRAELDQIAQPADSTRMDTRCLLEFARIRDDIFEEMDRFTNRWFATT